MPQDRSHPKQIEETVWALTQIKRWWTHLQGKLTLWMMLILPIWYSRAGQTSCGYKSSLGKPFMSLALFQLSENSFLCVSSQTLAVCIMNFTQQARTSSLWRNLISNVVDFSLEWQKTLMKDCSKTTLWSSFVSNIFPPVHFHKWTWYLLSSSCWKVVIELKICLHSLN